MRPLLAGKESALKANSPWPKAIVGYMNPMTRPLPSSPASRPRVPRARRSVLATFRAAAFRLSCRASRRGWRLSTSSTRSARSSRRLFCSPSPGSRAGRNDGDAPRGTAPLPTGADGRSTTTAILSGAIGSRSSRAMESVGRSFPLALRSSRRSPSAKAGSNSPSINSDWGSDYYRSTGLMMPADGREQIANTTRSWSGTKRASRWRGEIREGARPQVILSSGTAIRQTTPEAGY